MALINKRNSWKRAYVWRRFFVFSCRKTFCGFMD